MRFLLLFGLRRGNISMWVVLYVLFLSYCRKIKFHYSIIDCLVRDIVWWGFWSRHVRLVLKPTNKPAEAVLL